MWSNDLNTLILIHTGTKSNSNTRPDEYVGKADLVHTVQDWPVRLAVTDTLAKVQQVAPTELYSSEGGNELLNVFYHISHWNWRKRGGGMSDLQQ